MKISYAPKNSSDKDAFINKCKDALSNVEVDISELDGTNGIITVSGDGDPGDILVSFDKAVVHVSDEL